MEAIGLLYIFLNLIFMIVLYLFLLDVVAHTFDVDPIIVVERGDEQHDMVIYALFVV